MTLKETTAYQKSNKKRRKERDKKISLKQNLTDDLHALTYSQKEKSPVSW